MINKYIYTLITGTTFFLACQKKEKNTFIAEKVENQLYTISNLVGSWKYIHYSRGWSTKPIEQNDILVIEQDSSYQYFSDNKLQRKGRIKFEYYTQYDGFRGTILKFENWNYDFYTSMDNRQNQVFLTLSDTCDDCESFSFMKIESNKDRD